MANRMLVFSDVQGNSVALQAMFDYLQKLPDFDSLDFICLGDVACGYAPNTVLDVLREHEVTCIKGNMDDVILHPQPTSDENGDDEDEKRYDEMDLWTSEQLSLINRDFMAAGRINYVTDIAGKSYCFYHGTFSDPTDVLRHNMPEIDLKYHLSHLYDVQFTGQTHKQFMVPVDDQILINPGSIGLPGQMAGSAKRPLRAQFMMIDEGRFEFVTVHYKREDFTFAVMNSGMPHALWYLGQWDV